MNRILELSSKSSKGGRRKIRMVLLTLHKKDEKNLNGISWNEEQKQNLIMCQKKQIQWLIIRK